MNCQEFSRQLDAGELRSMPAPRRQAAETHLQHCDHCARLHDLHLRLAALPVPPLRQRVAAGWRADALLPESARRRRPWLRFLVPPALVAAAATAGILVTARHDSPQSINESTAFVQEPAPVDRSSPSPDDMTPASMNAARAGAARTPLPTVPVATTHSASPLQTVQLLPLRQGTDNANALAFARDYYDALTAELRQVAGLNLVVETEGASSLPDQAVDLRLGVTSTFGKVPERYGDYEAWNVTLSVEKEPAKGIYSRAAVGGVSANPECGRADYAATSGDITCTPAGMARSHVQLLLNWGTLGSKSADSVHQPAPIPALHTLIAQASGGDDAVRLRAVTLLSTHHPDDPQAFATLQGVAASDAALMVRKVAERVIAGELPWRQFVLQRIMEGGLLPEQRLEPLAWMMDHASQAETQAVAREIFESGRTRELAEVLAQAGRAAFRPVSLAIIRRMSAAETPGSTELLLALADPAPDIAVMSLLASRRNDPRIEQSLRILATSHPDTNLRNAAAALLDGSSGDQHQSVQRHGTVRP